MLCFGKDKEYFSSGNMNKSMIIHKIQRWPQATKPIRTNKNYNNQQGWSTTLPTTATCKNDKTVKDNNNKELFILHRYLCHHNKENLL